MSTISISSETLKQAQSYARDSRRLWTALAGFIDHDSINTDARKDGAEKAAANVGARMIRAKLPREAGALRASIEDTKQKAAALASKYAGKDGTFAGHCERKAVILECGKAIRFCELFIANYNEAKASQAQQTAKAA